MVDCGNLPPNEPVPPECRPVRVPGGYRPDPPHTLGMSEAMAIGGQVDQAAARTLEGRWLQFIRDSGGSASLNYLGGDVTDCLPISGGGDTLWIGADWLDGSSIDGDDTYGGSPLPVRNGSILATTPGSFAGAAQIYQTGTSGVWLNAVAHGGQPANTLWWPIAGQVDGATVRIFCWHVSNVAPFGPWGRLLDTHIVTLNAFGAYSSMVATGLGALTDKFWIDGILSDTSFVYIYGEEFVPDYDADLANNGSVPNYGKGELDGQFTVKRVARVAAGTITNPATWTYWNGSGWVSGVTNAVPMVDSDGDPVAGDAGVAKIRDGLYLMAAHRLTDLAVDVYNAAAPQGPWTRIARVPAAPQGAVIGGGRQVGQLTKILPTTEHPAGTPAEHRIAMISRNLLDPTDAFADRNIRRYAPQFVVIPQYGRVP